MQLSSEAITLAAGVLDGCTAAALQCSHEDEVDIPLPVIRAVGNTASNIIDALALDHTRHMSIKDRKQAVDCATSALSKMLKVSLEFVFEGVLKKEWLQCNELNVKIKSVWSLNQL